MFTQFANYLRKTKHFAPGKIRFASSMLASKRADISMTEQEAIFVLARLMSYVDGEQVEEEVSAMITVFCQWPFFVVFTKKDDDFKAFLDRTFDLVKTNEISDLVNACFDKVSKKHRPLAYAAMLEVAYSDQQLHPSEVELLELAKARFSIDEQTHQALTKSAAIRYAA